MATNNLIAEQALYKYTQYNSITTGLFDMDGTMYDTERLSTEGWMRGARKFHVPLTIEQVLSFRGQNMESNSLLFASWFPEGPTYWQLREVRDAYRKHYLDEHGLPEKPGLREILSYLKRDLGWRLCIVTGTSRTAATAYWNLTGILDFFDDTLTGDMVRVAKPDPTIYRMAAAKMGEKPEQCMVFEDSPNGIRSAHDAGCHSIMIFDQDRDMSVSGLCDFYCNSLVEAKAFLQKVIDRKTL